MLFRIVVVLLLSTSRAGGTTGRGWSTPESLEELGIKVELKSTGDKVRLEGEPREPLHKSPPPSTTEKKNEKGGVNEKAAAANADGEEEIVVPAVVLTHSEFEAANPMSTGARVVRENSADAINLIHCAKI